MTILKVILLYLGLVLIAIPCTTALFAANETAEEIKEKPKYPKKLLQIMCIVGFVLLAIGIALCL